MAENYATRDEIDRLGDRLTRDLRDTERLLRDRDDEKERVLRAEFVQAVQDSERRTHERLDHIDSHLTEQDRWIMRRRFVWSSWRRDLGALTVSTVIAALALRYIFHIPLP